MPPKITDDNAPEATEPRSRAEILDAIEGAETEMTALKAVHGADFDAWPTDALKAATDKSKAIKSLKARLAELPDSAGLKADFDAIGRDRSRVDRPKLGGQTAPGTGVEVKSERVEAGDSEYEKFVENGPFKSLAHFAHEVRGQAMAVRDGNGMRPAIKAWRDGVAASDNAIKALFGGDVKATPTGLGEFADPDGGLLVPIQLSEGIWKRSFDDFNLLGLCDMVPVSGNSVKLRAANDKSRADGSRNGGVSAYWTAEASQYTGSKPTYRTVDMRLNKLTVLVYATEELLEDGLGVEAEINRVASEEIRFKVNDALFRGTGVGMPLGFLNAAAKVTVASNNGANATISATDVDNMWARRARASGQGYLWLVNQDTEPQLASLNYATTNTGAVWAYTPGGLFGGSSTPMLKGKPVYYTEFNETLGTEGDIVLIDPKQIAVAVKSTGIRSAVSMHLRFDYDEAAFKFAFRMDARPYWETSLTRFKGSNALSPIITLESTRNS